MIAALRRRAEQRQQAGHGDAVALEALVREILDTGTARSAFVLRLSRLPQHRARPHHVRLAREALAPLAMADHARSFLLPNRDAVVVWRGEGGAALAESTAAIRLLFDDNIATLPDPAGLTATLDLPGQGETLLDLVAQSRRPAPRPARAPATLRPLDTPTLAALEAALARADIARMVRRRPVCSPADEGGWRLRWEWRRLALDELAEAFVPGTDLAADSWLLRRLSRTLDRRMLALLAAHAELRDAGPFGLALNVGSLFSAEFLRFDAALPAGLRGQVVLGLSASDMLADPPAFLFARDYARARQYRLMLRGVSAPLLAALPLARSGLDLLELAWTDDLAPVDPAGLAQEARRILLTAANNDAAVDWARRAGVGFLAGRLVAPPGWPAAGF